MLAYTSRYFNIIAPVIRHFLQKRYGYDLAKTAYDGARPIYRQMLADCPPVGSDNPMASNLYEACVFFSMYRAAKGEITPEMMRLVVDDIFSMRIMKRALSTLNLNQPANVARLNQRLHDNAAWVEDHPEVEPYTWDFNFGDSCGDSQVCYHFTRCPLNDFCREQDLMDILPVMCEIDHLTTRLMHGTLTREYTLATGGPVCDYLMRGDRAGKVGGNQKAGSLAGKPASNSGIIRLLSGHYGKRLERWFSEQGYSSEQANALHREYVSRFTEAMNEADFGPDNGKFSSYANCLSGVIAYAMARERGFSVEEAVGCYDFLAAPLRRFAAALWNTVDMLPNAYEIVAGNVRDDLTGPKGVCWQTEVIHDDDERFEYRCLSCLYYDICCEQGYPEAIQLFCNHDHHAWDGLHRHVYFARFGGIGERRADGSLSDGLSSTEQGCLCHDMFIRVH